MLNPWPIVIRLVLGLAVTIGAVVAINRYAEGPAEPPPDLRVVAFNAVYEDLEAGEARLKKWREPSGRTEFPGIGPVECGELRDAAAADRPANQGGSLLARALAPEATLQYVQLYNRTLRDLLRSRYGECIRPPGPSG